MKIDIIVPYVDETDELWQKDFNYYKELEINAGIQSSNNRQAFAKERIRDWKAFRYWFRGVEQNCPWIHKVFLVVQRESQIPKWLDRSNPKLRIVYHDEFIPKELLPTFSTLTIETFYYRISDLSEYFIVSNDDFYFLNNVSEDTFFKDNKIIQGTSGLRQKNWTCGNKDWEAIINNNNSFLEKYVIKHQVKEFYHYSHLPDGRVKSFETRFMQEHYDEIYKAMSVSRFRHPKNLIPSLLYIDAMKYTKYGILSDKVYSNSKYTAINSRTDFDKFKNYQMVCFNDTAEVGNDFIKCQKNLLSFLYSRLSEKSSFEIYDETSHLKICFGVPSWIPSKEPDRTLRKERLDRMFKQVQKLFGDVNWLIIAQNWKEYKQPDFIKNIEIVNKNELGILEARKTLQREFLKRDYDYIIMMDDDIIIECDEDACSRYIKEINKHIDGFCFLQYEAAQLNLCAISKSIYEKESMIDVNPQKDEGFEDVIYANLLHYKYPNKEFHISGIKCTQFQNPHEKAPSTWANSKHNFALMNKLSKYYIDHFKKGIFTIDKQKAKLYLETLKYIDKATFMGWISKEDAENLLKKYY